MISKRKHLEALKQQRTDNEISKQWSDIWDAQSDIETLQEQVKSLESTVRDIVAVLAVKKGK